MMTCRSNSKLWAAVAAAAMCSPPRSFIAYAASPTHRHGPLRAAQSANSPQGRFATIRTLSLDTETVRVTPTGTFVSVARTGSGPAAVAPSSGPAGNELTPGVTLELLHRHLPQLAGCAGTGATNGRIHGAVTLRLVIDPRGAVRDASAPQSTMIWSVPRCMTDAARAWQFPRPPGGLTIVVVWPLQFTSE